jgi:predicted nucleic acid-binding protein
VELSRIESLFWFAPDSPAIYSVWRKLVVDNAVSGVQVHDARLAAAMFVYHISHVLTFNTGDFSRFSHVTAVHPASLAQNS